MFRRIIGRGSVAYETKGKGRIGGRLSPEAVARAFKAVARSLKIPAEDIEFISGHSVRVGASQDLLALKLDLGSVMREGRWKTVRMPMRYGEHVMAASGGMARAAREQGETENPVHRNSQHVADPLLATVDGPRHSLAEEIFLWGEADRLDMEVGLTRTLQLDRRRRPIVREWRRARYPHPSPRRYAW